MTVINYCYCQVQISVVYRGENKNNSCLLKLIFVNEKFLCSLSLFSVNNYKNYYKLVISEIQIFWCMSKFLKNGLKEEQIVKLWK